MKPDKIAPALRSAHEALQAHVPAAPDTEAPPDLLGSLTHLGYVPSTATKPDRFLVLLQTSSETETANFDVVAEQVPGLVVNATRQSRIRTALVPVDQLDALSEIPEVEYIAPSRPLRFLLDEAALICHIAEYRENHNNATGEGVIVGIVDSGIDAAHPAFQNRVLRLWDQTMQGPGVPEGRYGVELEGADFWQSRDTHGHGTHVAGIAAGNDPAQPGYQGVAYGADLVVVKTSMQTAHIVDAVQYIFRIADNLGRPAVVNLSLGGHVDPHDGTDLLSTLIDDEVGPGRLVCCAAGNEGEADIHAHVTVPPQAQASVTFQAPSGLTGETVVLSGWIEGPGPVEVAVRDPGGQQTVFTHMPSSRAQLPGGAIEVTLGDKKEGRDVRQVIVSVTLAPQGAGTATPWEVLLQNPHGEVVKADFWLLDTSAGYDATFTGPCVSPDMKIGSPGAAERAITVASYTSRVQWQTQTGRHEVPWPLGELSPFSSPGPLRNGTQKPDLTAPGAMICSARSQFAQFPQQHCIGTHYALMAGTSMATPFITGILALELQKDPSLTPAAAKARLFTAVKASVGPSPGKFDPAWGHGLLDATQL